MVDLTEISSETGPGNGKREKVLHEKGLFDWLWDFFSGMKVAIVLLIVIAAVSIIGTVILQKGHPEQYVQTYGIRIYSLVGTSFLENFIRIDYDVEPQRYVDAFGGWTYAMLRALGLTHVYSSWWYLALLAMLGFSIFVCSTNRLRMILELGRRNVRDYDPDRLLNYTSSRRVEMRGGVSAAVEALRGALRGRRFRMRFGEEAEERVSFDAEKGTLRLWGAFITHSSILVIFAGALLGVYAGFEDYRLVPEGESFHVGRGDFWVRVDDASVEYDKMLRPLEYTSELAVFEGGKEVARKTIEVNHPLIYKGVYFYQSSFGAKRVEVRVEKPDGSAESAYMEPNRPSFVVAGLPRLFFGSDDVFADKNSPRIFLSYVDAGGSPRGLGWLTGEEPLSFMGVRLYLDDIWQYTGLQIKSDPGIPLVWVGCALLVAGMFMMFYIRRRRVFGAVHAIEGGAAVTIAGSPGRGDDGFAEDFKKLGDSLEKIADGKRSPDGAE